MASEGSGAFTPIKIYQMLEPLPPLFGMCLLYIVQSLRRATKRLAMAWGFRPRPNHAVAWLFQSLGVVNLGSVPRLQNKSGCSESHVLAPHLSYTMLSPPMSQKSTKRRSGGTTLSLFIDSPAPSAQGFPQSDLLPTRCPKIVQPRGSSAPSNMCRKHYLPAAVRLNALKD